MKETKKPKIQIKPENKGKFTKFCTNKGHKSVTNKCIDEGLASKFASVRKQAQFAKNASEWNK